MTLIHTSMFHIFLQGHSIQMPGGLSICILIKKRKKKEKKDEIYFKIKGTETREIELAVNRPDSL